MHPNSLCKLREVSVALLMQWAHFPLLILQVNAVKSCRMKTSSIHGLSAIHLAENDFYISNDLASLLETQETADV